MREPSGRTGRRAVPQLRQRHEDGGPNGGGEPASGCGDQRAGNRGNNVADSALVMWAETAGKQSRRNWRSPQSGGGDARQTKDHSKFHPQVQRGREGVGAWVKVIPTAAKLQNDRPAVHKSYTHPVGIETDFTPGSACKVHFDKQLRLCGKELLEDADHAQ